MHARRNIRDGDRHAMRWPVLRARHAHQSRHALGNEVEAAALAIGAGLAEAGDGGVDQARVAGRQRRPPETQPLERAGPEILDQDVGAIDQLQQLGLAGLGLEVDDDRALVAVPDHEGRAFAAHEGRHATRIVAAVGPLDLDDVGAVVGQQHRAVGARQMARQVHDREPLQRTRLRHWFFPDVEFGLLCPTRARHARGFCQGSSGEQGTRGHRCFRGRTAWRPSR